MNELLMSSTAAAKFLGVAPSTVKRWADDGRLNCVKTSGGHRRFRMQDLRSFNIEIEFEPKSFYEQLPLMSPDALDALDVGVIQLDDEGCILQYNAKEAVFSGYSAREVLGRLFFVDVAPCTNNRLVFGRFREGVRSGRLNHSIPYTFTYVMEPTIVLLQLFRDSRTATNWLVINHRV